jgi:hypothetical protein
MMWINRPFIDYLNAVDRILENSYGVTSNDTGVEMIASCQETLLTPSECAEQIGNQLELVQITAKPL